MGDRANKLNPPLQCPDDAGYAGDLGGRRGVDRRGRRVLRAVPPTPACAAVSAVPDVVARRMCSEGTRGTFELVHADAAVECRCRVLVCSLLELGSRGS